MSSHYSGYTRPRHRTPPVHDEAPVLLGAQKEVSVRHGGIVESEPFSDGIRYNPGRPDREAAEVPDRGQVVRVEPVHETGTGVEKLNPSTPPTGLATVAGLTPTDNGSREHENPTAGHRPV